ncbi:MAG: hypothetical protein D6712_01200 [Chloroflexi bacterium]|nr:MAG: hypothetical protein D6712_01200 [Chloroflexota bacterium]
MLSLIARNILPFQNIIYRAELKHQRYIIRTSRSGIIWIILALIMLIPALLASLGFTLITLIRPLNAGIDNLIAGDWVTGIVVLMVTMNLALYPVVHLVTVGLAGQSIIREKAGKTWELLRITNVSGLEIVRGKWWATLRALWGDHLMVSLLRLGPIAILITYYYETMKLAYPAFPNMPKILGLPPQWAQMPLLIVIMVIYTLLDAGLSAALGIFTTLLSEGSPIGLLVAIALRLIFMALALWWTVVTFATVYGSLLFIPISLVGFIVYGLFIWALLWISQFLVR